MIDTTAGAIRELVGGELRGDPQRPIRSIAPLDTADREALSFVASARYLPYLQATRAGAVLVTAEWLGSVPAGAAAIVVDDPHRALQVVLTTLHSPRTPTPGIHPTAVVDASAQLEGDVSVGPFAVVEAGVRVGPGSAIGAHSVLGRDSRVGRDVTIHPHVTVYPGVVLGDRVVVHSGARLGKEGFGFVWSDGGHRKIPQVGGCVIEDDVEVGANVTIDRGSVGDTVVGAGSKIDNLAHLGHNVKVGSHVLLLGQIGISGSTRVGDGAVLAGQVGVAGHLSIGAGARVGAQGGVISDVPEGATYSGYPARPHREALRAQANLFRLPRLIQRLRSLEAAVFGRSEK